MKEIFGFLLGIFVSLLPPRYRGSHDMAEFTGLKGPAIVSGLLQILGFLYLHFYHLIYVYSPALQGIGMQVVESGSKEIEKLALGQLSASLGIMGWIAYMINPVSLLLTYFLLEGMVRFIAALSAGETVATLPLALLARLHNRLDKTSQERALGPKAPDLVETGDGTEFDLRVSCSRPKEKWDRLMTISYKDELYEMAEHQQGEPPRRFVYLLRKMPPGKIVRGLEHYRPGEE